MRASHKAQPVFDDPNLVGAAGLVPMLRLAETAGLHELLEAGLTVDCPNAARKATGVVAGMLTGADSIDDLAVLRHGGMPRLLDGVRAPSTLGTFLRSFTHGHVQQLDAAGARLLAGLSAAVPGLLAGGGPGGIAFVDIDDTVRQVHGYAKQGAAFGYTAQRGLNLQLAPVSTPTAAPVIAAARLRRGNVASAAGCARLLAQAINTARRAGAGGQVLVRADSAYYGWALVGTAIRHDAWFSVTARKTATVNAAIADIPDDAWRTIDYPDAVYDTELRCWISSAQVAETAFVAFTGRRKAEHVTCRLVVRRVRRLQPAASDGTVQGELLAAHRHHAFITNSTLTTVQADQRHRDHAIIEQVIAELKDGPLAHLPSGSYAANAAWVALAVIAFNLARAVAAGSGERTLGHPAPTAHPAARPPRRHRTTARAAPAPAVAVGQQLAAALDQRHQPPGSHLHLTARRKRPDRKQKWKSRSRPETQTCPQPDTPSQQDHSHLREVRRWIRAELHNQARTARSPAHQPSGWLPGSLPGAQRNGRLRRYRLEGAEG